MAYDNTVTGVSSETVVDYPCPNPACHNTIRWSPLAEGETLVCVDCRTHFDQFGQIYQNGKKLESTSTQGVKLDQDKPIMALLPPRALLEEAKVWSYGSVKYDSYNWTKGIVYSRIIGASLRHIMAIMMGEDVDEESGCLHAACVRCNMAMLIEFTLTKRTELDDRYKG